MSVMAFNIAPGAAIAADLVEAGRATQTSKT
jgi:hypothetical protein